MQARRVAGLWDRSPPFVRFADITLEALLTHDLGEARSFVNSQLGGLLGSDGVARRLRATLEVYLEEDSSYVRAARRLGVHENTVVYRVHRAEELLSRRTAERQLELRAALRLAHFAVAPGCQVRPDEGLSAGRPDHTRPSPRLR